MAELALSLKFWCRCHDVSYQTLWQSTFCTK